MRIACVACSWQSRLRLWIQSSSALSTGRARPTGRLLLLGCPLLSGRPAPRDPLGVQLLAQRPRGAGRTGTGLPTLLASTGSNACMLLPQKFSARWLAFAPRVGSAIPSVAKECSCNAPLAVTFCLVIQFVEYGLVTPKNCPCRRSAKTPASTDVVQSFHFMQCSSLCLGLTADSLHYPECPVCG